MLIKCLFQRESAELPCLRVEEVRSNTKANQHCDEYDVVLPGDGFQCDRIYEGIEKDC